MIDDLAAVIAHWCADQIGGLSDGDPVDTLPDSIASWNLTGSSTTRPLYRPTGINSLPAIEFDGTDDFMVSASQAVTASRLGMAVVFAFSIKNYNPLMYLTTNSSTPINNSSSRAGSFGYSGGNIRSETSNGSSVAYRYGLPAVATDTTCLLTSYHYPGRIGYSIDGSDAIATSSAGDGIGADLSSTTLYAHLGRRSTSYLDGMVSEIVLWDEGLLCESLYIEGLLAHKYGITLPDSHPFYAAAPTAAPGSGGGGTYAFTGIRNRGIVIP